MLARLIPALLVAALCPPAAASDLEGGTTSASFCLFELPGDGTVRRLINLGIVQYVELSRDELRIAYGGGNLGSGHEARLPLKTAEEGVALVRRMQQTARGCDGFRQRTAPLSPKEKE